MLTKSDILTITRQQLALDFGCEAADFERPEITIVEPRLLEGRRVYESDGSFLRMLVFGSKAVISAAPEILPWCAEHLGKRDPAWLFEHPKLRMIDNKLREYGHEIADMHQFYLPKPGGTGARAGQPPAFAVCWYEQDQLQQFKDDERFGEAFAFDENRPDVLAVAALDGEKIMGMAGASADSATMWQIGIDTVPEYRGRGVGTALTALITEEILRRGKVPFYGTAISHFHSQNIAINAGFFPAWAELYTRRVDS